MADIPARGRNGDNESPDNGGVRDAVSDWFVREVLPLEAILMHYLQRNWRNVGDIADLRQEVYLRVCTAARESIPVNTKPFLLSTARNLLIDLVKHQRVVPIEAVADVDMLDVPADTAGPDRVTAARDELRRLQGAIDRLPPKAREVFHLAYVEDLSAQEIARRLGVNKSTISRHIANGLRLLADMLYSEAPDKSEKPR